MKRQVATLCLILLLFSLAFGSASAPVFTGPTAAAVGPVTAITAFGKVIFLNATSPEGCALTYAIASGPSHGTLSNLNSATGVVIYTSNAGYTGSDSLTYHATAFTTGSCTTGSTTSSDATVTVTVANTKTVVNGQLTDASGNALSGTITWSIVQPATTFDGFYILQGSSVTRTLDNTGSYTVSLYPTTGLSPNTLYMAKYQSGALSENLGLYNIPAEPTGTVVTQAILNANRVATVGNAQFVIASETAVEALAASVGSAAAAAASSASDAAASAVAAASSATSAAAASHFSLTTQLIGLPTNGQTLLIFPAVDSFTLSLTGSVCQAGIAANTQTDFLVKYCNGSSDCSNQANFVTKATLRFAASGKTCTLISPISTAVSANDVIELVGPSPADIALSNLAFTLKGTRP